MRNFRNAAIAGATAVALTFGGASVATAAPAEQDAPSSSSSQENGTTNNGSSNDSTTSGSSEGTSWQSRFGELLGNDHDAKVTGKDLWGKERNPEGKNPQVAETLRGLSIALGVFAGFTFLIAPIYNFFKFGPFAK